MRNKRVVNVFSILCLLVATTGLLHANAISGSFPFAAFNVSENGGDLLGSNMLGALNTLTSATGKGDFASMPQMTSFGGFSLNETMMSSGGGFSISNPMFGTFVASSGTIVLATTHFQDIDLIGTFTPGSAFPTLTARPATIDLSFTENGGSVSASGTLLVVPEPGTILLLPGSLALFWIRGRKLLG